VPCADCSLLELVTSQQRTLQLLAERCGNTPAPPADNEALAYVRTVANELRAAGQELLHAAEKLKAVADDPNVPGKGYLHAANKAFQAGQRAVAQAEQLARA
jgi:hypothetical protein